jgi:hypothetical protein
VQIENAVECGDMARVDSALDGMEVLAERMREPLPGPDCPARKHERVIAGHAPTATCTWHQHAHGELAVNYPSSLAGWARRQGLGEKSLALRNSSRAESIGGPAVRRLDEGRASCLAKPKGDGRCDSC